MIGRIGRYRESEAAGYHSRAGIEVFVIGLPSLMLNLEN
jgi:hypothetical protein